MLSVVRATATARPSVATSFPLQGRCSPPLSRPHVFADMASSRRVCAVHFFFLWFFSTEYRKTVVETRLLWRAPPVRGVVPWRGIEAKQSRCCRWCRSVAVALTSRALLPHACSSRDRPNLYYRHTRNTCLETDYKDVDVPSMGHEYVELYAKLSHEYVFRS